jgi:hypothetical protein
MPTPGSRETRQRAYRNGPTAHRRLADLGASMSPIQARGCPEAYALFDVDRRRGGDGNARSNRALLRLLGRPPEDFPDTQVHGSFACFEETLLGTVRGELGAQAVEAALDRAFDRFGFTPDGRKNGVVLGEAFHLLAGQGLTSPTLSALMDRVATLGAGS